jgi:hypothetical protein
VAENSENTDFHVTLLIADSDIDDVCRVFAFRSQLGLDFGHVAGANIQRHLEQRHMHHCYVHYDTENRSGLEIKAEKVEFMEDDDSGLN